MNINTAKFLESNPSVKTCPSPHMPEYAFIGRSNVGKSSLINAMTNRSSLAKTSSTPGKTQLINHFLINEDWYLVDLPGYGWAKVSKSQRRDFEGLITEYLSERKNLVVTFVLIDIRHEPQAIDLEFLEWLAENEIPFCIVFTKADKLNNSKLVASLARYEEVLKSRWEVFPPNFITSSLKNEGTEDILFYIEKYNKALEEKFSQIQPIKVTKEELPQPQKPVTQRKKYNQIKPYKKEENEGELNEFEKKTVDKNAPKPSKYAAPRKTNSKYTVPFSDSNQNDKPAKNTGKRPEQNVKRNSKATGKKEFGKDEFSKDAPKKFTKKPYKGAEKGEFSKDAPKNFTKKPYKGAEKGEFSKDAPKNFTKKPYKDSEKSEFSKDAPKKFTKKPYKGAEKSEFSKDAPKKDFNKPASKTSTPSRGKTSQKSTPFKGKSQRPKK
jgi:GTP-binding protein